MLFDLLLHLRHGTRSIDKYSWDNDDNGISIYTYVNTLPDHLCLQLMVSRKTLKMEHKGPANILLL